MARFTMQSFVILEGVSTLAKSESYEASGDNAAVDAARTRHEEIVPNIGGDYEIVVTALDLGITEMVRDEVGAYVPRPPGEISRFGVTHEPHPSVAEEVYAQRAAKDAATSEAVKVAAIRAQVLAEVMAAAPPDVAKAIGAVVEQVQEIAARPVEVQS